MKVTYGKRPLNTNQYQTGEKTTMKYLIVLSVGVALGVGGAAYHYDSKFRAQANTHIDSAVSTASEAAHKQIKSAN